MSTDVKTALAKKTESQTQTPVKLTKNMSIVDMIKVLEPEIRRALPSILTPERFTRMALSAINNTPKLAECTPMSFIAALMNAAQLGLEPNTPLGQAYLIPYKNKGIMECEFQIGYKGLIDLVYRSNQVQTIYAQTVYEGDSFQFEFGLNPVLQHKPTAGDQGDMTYVYAVFKTVNGGYGFEVMSKNAIDTFAKEHSKSYTSSFSPWQTAFDEMAKKTVLKKALKYAPVKVEFQRALSADETIKTELAIDMSEIRGEILDAEYHETA